MAGALLRGRRRGFFPILGLPVPSCRSPTGEELLYEQVVEGPAGPREDGPGALQKGADSHASRRAQSICR